MAVMAAKGDSEPAAVQRAPGQRLTPQIARLIRELIISGKAPGGTRLRTEHLAARFGVSATPVREALMALHGEGLVSFQPGRGFAVLPMTRRDLLDVFGTQAYLTAELTARAAVSIDDQQFDNLWKIHHELVRVIAAEEHAEAERIEFEFHQAVNHIADAPKLRWLLRSTVSYAPFQNWYDAPGWASGAPEDHMPLLRALTHRNPDAARAAMTAHIMNVAEMLADMLAERGVLVEEGSSE
jgi:DNA-binding GntR family transcriptional regulator